MTLNAAHSIGDTGHTSDHNSISTQVNQNTTDIAARITTAAASAAFDNTVVHGSTAGTARPAGATLVHWVGSVDPANKATNDHWTDTANKLVKYWDGASWQVVGSAASGAAGSDWKNFVKDYGADPTGVAGGHAAKLNQWFSDTPNGGTLYVPDGVYLFNDAQTTATAFTYTYNGQVLIPARSQAQARPTWRIVGAHQQIHGHFGSVLSENEPLAPGAVFKTTVTSGSFFDVIPGLLYNSTTPLTNAIVELENLSIRTPYNHAVAALNLQACGGMSLRGVSVEVDVTDGTFASPGNFLSGSVGIWAPGINNQTLVSIKNSAVYGYNMGLRISEHAVLDGFNAQACNIGIMIDQAGHPIVFNKVMLQWNTIHIRANSSSSGAAVYGSVGFESKTSGWWPTTTDIYDDGNKLSGELTYAANGNATYVPLLNGATKLRLRSLWQVNTLPAAGSPLASAGYNPASKTTITTTSTTFAALDTTNLAVTFTAPPSGTVVVALCAWTQVGNGTALNWGILSGGSLVTGSSQSVAYQDYDAGTAVQLRTTTRIKITGLSAGTSYTWQWAHARTFGSGTAQTVYGGTAAPDPGQAVMEVWAHP